MPADPSFTPTYTSRKLLLPDEPPHVYQASLVRHLGMHKAAVIQQIHYLLGLPDSGRDYEGHHWIWKSAAELGGELGLTESQTRLALKALYTSSRETRIDERGIRRGIPEHTPLIAIHNPFKGWDQTLWYRINYHHEHLQVTKLTDASDESVTWSADSVRCKSRKRRIDMADSWDASDDIDGAIPKTTSKDYLQEETTLDHTDRRPHKQHSKDGARDSLSDALTVGVEDESKDMASLKAKVRRGPVPEWHPSAEPTESDSAVEAVSDSVSDGDAPRAGKGQQRMEQLRTRAAEIMAQKDAEEAAA
jgi:hypothetical protein